MSDLYCLTLCNMNKILSVMIIVIISAFSNLASQICITCCKMYIYTLPLLECCIFLHKLFCYKKKVPKEIKQTSFCALRVKLQSCFFSISGMTIGCVLLSVKSKDLSKSEEISEHFKSCWCSSDWKRLQSNLLSV